MRCRIVLTGLIVTGLWAVCTSSQELTVPEVLSPAEEEHLFNQAAALFRPDLLPKGSPYIRKRATCGTPVVMALAQHWPVLSKTTQDAFRHLFQRTTLPNERTLESASGRFLIHYTTIGTDRVDATDLDANGVPDYVDEAARNLDLAWETQIGEFGYLPPPDDGDVYHC